MLPGRWCVALPPTAIGHRLWSRTETCLSFAIAVFEQKNKSHISTSIEFKSSLWLIVWHFNLFELHKWSGWTHLSATLIHSIHTLALLLYSNAYTWHVYTSYVSSICPFIHLFILLQLFKLRVAVATQWVEYPRWPFPQQCPPTPPPTRDAATVAGQTIPCGDSQDLSWLYTDYNFWPPLTGEGQIKDEQPASSAP